MDSPIVEDIITAAQAQDDGLTVDPYATGPGLPPGHCERLQAAVEDYHARGIAVVPIGLGEKVPKHRGWNLQDHDADEFTARHNVGILTGALSGDLVCVDLDDGTVLAKADEYLPETGLIEFRASKRRSHRYYRVFMRPPASCASGQQFGGPRTVQFRHTDQHMLFEVLGTGRHAAAPPSLHPSGEERAWESFAEPAAIDCLELYRAAERLAVACGGRAHLDVVLGTATPGAAQGGRPDPQFQSVGVGGRCYHPDLPPMDERRARARGYLARLDPAVSGQAGHDRTFYAACLVVRDFAIDPEDARDLLDEFNAGCQSPWSDAELEHKLRDADHFDGLRGSKLIAAAHEKPTDPYRLADLFLAQEPHPEGRTWRFWREEWWHWDGQRLIKIADSELRARLGTAIRAEMEEVQRRQARAVTADYERRVAEGQQAGGAEEKRPKLPKMPTIIPVTASYRAGAPARAS